MSTWQRRLLQIVCAMSAGFCVTPAVLATVGAPGVNEFIGPGSDYFTASHWSLGHVPLATEDVLVRGGRTLVVDPSASASPAAVVRFRDLTIDGQAVFETRPGTVLVNRHTTVVSGQYRLRSSQVSDDPNDPGRFDIAPCIGSGCTVGGLGNPSTKSQRDLVLKSTFRFGLSGTTAASMDPGAVGAGHYATLLADVVELDAELALQLLDGFMPDDGDLFQIVTVGRGGAGTGQRTGTFTGLAEGALAATYGDVGLFISYQGGDGNDITLRARTVPEPASVWLLVGTAAAWRWRRALASRRRPPTSARSRARYRVILTSACDRTGH